MQQTWIKTIVSAIYSHFADLGVRLSGYDGSQVVIVFEQEFDNLPESVSSFYFLRIANIDVVEYTRGSYVIEVDINLLVSVRQSQSIYTLDDLVGAGLTKFVDIDTSIGCLHKMESINIQKFGMIDENMRIYQTGLTAKYVMETQ